MGTCKSCGKRKWRLKSTKCFVCGKEGCTDCSSNIITILFGYSANEEFDKTKLYVCSSNCKENFVNLVEHQIEQTPLDLNAPKIDLFEYIESTIDSNNFYLDEKITKDLNDYPFKPNRNGLYHFYGSIENLVFERINKILLFKKARILIQVGRFEDAARIYENLGMYEEAGKARREDKHLSIKKTNVIVDLNSLLKQIKDGGLIVVYRCPHCNAPLKVNKESNIDSLRICSHCNSEIKSMDIADFLKTALS